MVKNSEIKGTTSSATAGHLFGYVWIPSEASNVKINAVGISVVIDDSVFVSNPAKNIPSKDINYESGKNLNANIVYADYLGMEKSVDGNKAPYVTVNPNYTLDGENKQLTGDMVGFDTEYNSVAARIWAEQKLPVESRSNHVTYQNTSTIIAKDAPEVSTFRAEQGCGPDNLPVLTIKNGNATAIEDYLNVITNGGYGTMPKWTDDKKANTVKLSVSVYYYDDADNRFALATPEQLKKDPASVYLDGTKIKVLGNSYDNTRNRFSLVEAAFTVEVNGEKRT